MTPIVGDKQCSGIRWSRAKPVKEARPMALIALATLIIYSAKEVTSVSAVACPFNVNIERLKPANFEGTVVYPFVERGSSSVSELPFSTLNHTTGLHVKRVNVRLLTSAGGDKDHVLQLTLNEELLSKGLRTNVGSSTRTIPKNQEACFYQGVCVQPGHKEEDSFAAVSTCRGLRGTFHSNGQTFYVQPVDSSPPTAGSINCWPHILLRFASGLHPGGALFAHEEPAAPNHLRCGVRSLASTGDGRGVVGAQWVPFQDLHASEYSAKMHESGSSPLSSDQVLDDTKKINLAIIVDRAFLLQKNVTDNDMAEYLLSTVNIVDEFYRRLDIRVALAYYQVPRNRNEVPVLANVRETLQNLVSYTLQGRMKEYSATALLTTQTFEGGVYGLAVPDSVCSQRAVAVASDVGVGMVQPHVIAGNLAHLLGHVLGLQHDEQECMCSDSIGCLMEDNWVPADVPKKFSKCSAERARILSRAELWACLVPESKLAAPYQQFCGNGVIERGEQCDCGPPARCHLVDPCCDAATCLLKPSATCREGVCCENCKAKSRSTICRLAQGDCDVPEYCDGISGECPGNVLVQDGQPCWNATASCFRGQCRSRNAQCSRLWGADASSAAEHCYFSLNTQGDVHGHCGDEPDDGPDGVLYRKCEARDASCGLLQCTGGSVQSKLRDQFSSNAVAGSGAIANQAACRSLTMDTQFVKPTAAGVQQTTAMVEDGTPCGGGQICLSQACVPISTLVTRSCPLGGTDNQPCSGRGVCTSKVTCFCEKGYGGPNCGTRLNVSSLSDAAGAWVVPSAPSMEATTAREGEQLPGVSQDGQSLDVRLLVLASVIGAAAVVAAAVAVIIFRRRRHGLLSRQKAAQHASLSLNGRPLSFGALSSPRSGGRDRSTARRRPDSLSGSLPPSPHSSDDERSDDEADDECDGAGKSLVDGSCTDAVKIPEELFRQPMRSILKKTPSRPRDGDDLFSSETCSCSDSEDDDDSTSWDATDREGPPIVHSLPRRPKSSTASDDGDAKGRINIEACAANPAATTVQATNAAATATAASLTLGAAEHLQQGDGPLWPVGSPVQTGALAATLSPLLHRALAAAGTLTEDSGNGTEASPGASDDCGSGGTVLVSRGAGLALGSLAVQPASPVGEPVGKGRSRVYAVPVPVPPMLPAVCTGITRGAADGSCEADCSSEHRPFGANAPNASHSAQSVVPSQPGLSSTFPLVRDGDRRGSGAALTVSGGLSVAPPPPPNRTLGRTELVGLSPARVLLSGQCEFVKPPSLTTFLPLSSSKLAEGDPSGRAFSSRPAQGPALTFGSGAHEHMADGGASSKRRPNVLDVKSTVDWADA